MALRINSSTDAANASRLLSVTQSQLSVSLQQLASGKRINAAADDAAGLAISEALNSQIRGLSQGVRNAQDGVSLIQTADAALAQTTDSLQRIRELTVQAGNGTLDSGQRAAIQNEISAITQSVDQVAGQTQFNGKQILNGSTSSLQVQIGANVGAQDTTQITLPNASASALGVGPGQVDVSTPQAANASLARVDQAIDRVSSSRGALGGQENGLQHAIASANVGAVNQASAQSQIRDLDFAKGIAALTRQRILADSGTAVLAQANFGKDAVLKLLG